MRIRRLFSVLLLAGLAWILLESYRAAPASYTRSAGKDRAELIVPPGRTSVSLSIFLVIAAALPTVYLAALAMKAPAAGQTGLAGTVDFPDKPTARWLDRAYRIMAVLGLCATSTIAGFGYETLQTEVRINQQGVTYVSGAARARMGWDEIRLMVLHWNRRSQIVELRGTNDEFHIDLTTFSPPDRVLVVKMMEHFARLSPTQQRGPAEWVWRKRKDNIEIRDQ